MRYFQRNLPPKFGFLPLFLSGIDGLVPVTFIYDSVTCRKGAKNKALFFAENVGFGKRKWKDDN